MNGDSLIYALLNTRGWGPKRIINYCSQHCFDVDECMNNLFFEFDDFELSLLKQKIENYDKIFKEHEKDNIFTISLLNSEFPRSLYDGTDSCVFLFYKGNIKLLNKNKIAIIGTRTPTLYFQRLGYEISKEVAKRDWVIVSGLALGCDTIAHKASCDFNGQTIAILPSSIKEVQPVSNKELSEKIVSKGGLLISEYENGTPFNKFNYPQRDRIQSLLSDKIIVIQASDNSGTMIAVKKSLKDGKEVYALKGNNISLVQNYIEISDIEQLLKF